MVDDEVEIVEVDRRKGSGGNSAYGKRACGDAKLSRSYLENQGLENAGTQFYEPDSRVPTSTGKARRPSTPNTDYSHSAVSSRVAGSPVRPSTARSSIRSPQVFSTPQQTPFSEVRRNKAAQRQMEREEHQEEEFYEQPIQDTLHKSLSQETKESLQMQGRLLQERQDQDAEELRRQYMELLSSSEQKRAELERQLNEFLLVKAENGDSGAHLMEREADMQHSMLEQEKELWAKYERMQREYELEMKKQMDKMRAQLAKEREHMAQEGLAEKRQVELDRTACEAKLRKEYDQRMQVFLDAQHKMGQEHQKAATGVHEQAAAESLSRLAQQEHERMRFEEECRSKYTALIEKEQQHWRSVDSGRERAQEEQAIHTEDEYRIRQERECLERLEYEQKVVAEAKEREVALIEAHGIEMRRLQAQVDDTRDGFLEHHLQDKTASQEELLVYQARLRQELQDHSRAREEKLRQEHLQKEASLITEAEQLRAELREREHQMAVTMHRNDQDDRVQRAEERAFRAEQEAAHSRQIADTAEAATKKKIKTVQIMMNEAMAKEKAMMQRNYESQLSSYTEAYTQRPHLR